MSNHHALAALFALAALAAPAPADETWVCDPSPSSRADGCSTNSVEDWLEDNHAGAVGEALFSKGYNKLFKRACDEHDENYSNKDSVSAKRDASATTSLAIRDRCLPRISGITQKEHLRLQPSAIFT